MTDLRIPASITEAEYHRMVRDSSGICTECRHERFGDTEPDAEGYPCDNEDCEANAVVGIENALMDGTIDIAS